MVSFSWLHFSTYDNNFYLTPWLYVITVLNQLLNKEAPERFRRRRRNTSKPQAPEN
jgi:hypothetical protein